MGQLDGKVALITGGARGMGKAHVRRFLDEGAKVVFGDVLEEEGAKLAADLGDGVRFVRMDVSKEEDWQRAAETATDVFGTLNVLVNNAGILRHKTIEDMELDEFRRILDVNLIGQWLGVKTVTAPMRAAGGGSIVNVSSILGTVGGLGNSAAYHAAKGAVRTLTKNAALHWATAGVRVNSLHPGFIGTAQLLERYEGTPRHEAMLANTPVGRLGRGEEVAAAVAFLVSDDATYMTGSEVYVDGGYTAR
jgi:3alpha(or 20beta)-hydroxysteroid dehydrogenase